MKIKRLSILIVMLVLSVLMYAQTNTFPSSGKVGIGTTAPPEILSVRVASDNILNVGYQPLLNAVSLYGSDDATAYHKLMVDGSILMLNTRSGGNVGIGTAFPTEKLSVNGTILTKKIRVSQSWADYVFDTAYVLRPLHEVHHFIKVNKHLPDMPPAKEIEDKGLDLGEIVKQQQVKIEELTLYLIAIKQEMEELKKKVQK